MPEVIYTIGHGNLSFMKFLSLIQANNITQIIDIRSIPYSRKAPWSNKSRLSQLLKPLGIRYTYLGHKFNDKNQAVTPHGLASQPNSAQAYLEAVSSVLLAAEKRQVALLCTEGDPAHCIRQNVIAQTLLNRDIKVAHILHNGNLTEAWQEPDSPKQPELF
ncbi:MAG: DUF488 domain-containing protein [Anaerolineaceae bacterium]|nr:DUF488 domain-containing protein [Anaerolineaceae bacterium]